jgi:hypothetical protein
MNKNIAIIGLFVSIVGTAQAQRQPDPVHWRYTLTKAPGNAYALHLVATMDAGWHIYSGTQPKEAIAVPTKIVLDKSPLVNIMGRLTEKGKKETYRDPVAGIVQFQYGDSVDFVQPLTIKTAVKSSIHGTITYQACTSEMCLPPKTINFSVEISE